MLIARVPLSSPSVLMANVRRSESDFYISILNLVLMGVLNGFGSHQQTHKRRLCLKLLSSQSLCRRLFSLQTFSILLKSESTIMMDGVIILKQACRL